MSWLSKLFRRREISASTFPRKNLRGFAAAFNGASLSESVEVTEDSEPTQVPETQTLGPLRVGAAGSVASGHSVGVLCLRENSGRYGDGQKQHVKCEHLHGVRSVCILAVAPLLCRSDGVNNLMYFLLNQFDQTCSEWLNF